MNTFTFSKQTQKDLLTLKGKQQHEVKREKQRGITLFKNELQDQVFNHKLKYERC